MTALLVLALQVPPPAQPPPVAPVEPLSHPWALEWGIRGPGLVRFNRVEGLSVGARLQTRHGPFRVSATGRIGHGDWTPNVDVGWSRFGPDAVWTIRAYSGLRTVDPRGSALAFPGSVRAVLLARDEGEYFRASGIGWSIVPSLQEDPVWELSLYGEAQRAVRRGVERSLGSILCGPSLRPVIRADAGEVVGVYLRARPHRGDDPRRTRAGLDAWTRLETGSHSTAQASLTAWAAAPIAARTRVAVVVQGAVTRGDPVPQRQWYLGGVSTARGYPGSQQAGRNLFRARVELSRSFVPGAVVLFGDGGWAGDSTGGLTWDAALFSVGAGFSVLDDILRVDVARALRTPTGWSVEAYLAAGIG